MSGGDGGQGATTVLDRLRLVVYGTRDSRVRATYRVLLAWPVLWLALGLIAVGVAGVLLPEEASKAVNMTVAGTLQGLSLAVGLFVWARYLDQRRLHDYGLSGDADWLVDLVVGFSTVMVGTALWLGVASSQGWVTVESAMTTPGSPLVLGLAGVFWGVIVNVWVQETVFVGVILTNAAEGLASRDLNPKLAVICAWGVAVLLFTVQHRPSEPGSWLNLLLGLGVYALLYVHTGELALSIGVHTGVNYAGHTLVGSPEFAAQGPTMMQASNSLTGLAGSLSGGAIPQILMAYLLVLGWLRWRDGEVTIETRLAEWTPLSTAGTNNPDTRP